MPNELRNSQPFEEVFFAHMQKLPNGEAKQLLLALKQKDEAIPNPDYPHLMELLQALDDAIAVNHSEKPRRSTWRESAKAFKFTPEQEAMLGDIQRQQSGDEKKHHRRQTLKMVGGTIMGAVSAKSGFDAIVSYGKRNEEWNAAEDLQEAAMQLEEKANDPRIPLRQQQELKRIADGLECKAMNHTIQAGQEGVQVVSSGGSAIISAGFAAATVKEDLFQMSERDSSFNKFKASQYKVGHTLIRNNPSFSIEASAERILDSYWQKLTDILVERHQQKSPQNHV